MLWFVKSKRAQNKDDDESWKRGGVTPTLNAFDMGDTRATVVICYPIDDGREMEKKQNGTGIGEEGAPSYTLDRAQHASVAIAPTLTAYNMDSRSPQSEESQRIVQAVHETTSVIRRLTPTECERLQGFPDGWTEGQTDGHRYKQMGNAVAVPVVEWIMERLVEHDRV